MTAEAPTEFGSFFEFIRNGMNVRQDKDGTGLPISRIETISDGTVDLSRVGYAGLERRDVDKWLLEPGDILFSHINSVEHIGKCALYEGSNPPLVHGMNLLCLRPKQSKISPRFAKWLIKCPSFKTLLLPFVNKAVNQASISIGNLTSIHIAVPGLVEQKRIAAILDQADEIRGLRQRAIERLNGLGQAIFYEMFGDPVINPMGWPAATLGEIVRSDDKINYGVVQPGDDVNDGVPLIRVADLLNPVIDVTKIKHISTDVETAYSRSRLKGDEVLVGCVGSIGAIALATGQMKGANIARAVARVPVDRLKADRFFIAEQLNSPPVQRYFKLETRTVAQPTLNIKQLIETPILLPPLEIQERFAQIKSKFTQIKLDYAAHLARSQALFASIQNRAFRGEL